MSNVFKPKRLTCAEDIGPVSHHFHLGNLSVSRLRKAHVLVGEEAVGRREEQNQNLNPS